MLAGAEIRFEKIVPNVDEAATKEKLRAQSATPEAIAAALAELKAVAMSANIPGAVVLGSDQILECEGRLFTKAVDMHGARETLRALRGKSHRLISAAVLARDGAAIWRATENAYMTLRSFSEEFLEQYLAVEGEHILGSVGCYRIEAMGVQLFSEVRGDQFVVRGMPLLPVLEALRAEGVTKP